MKRNFFVWLAASALLLSFAAVLFAEKKSAKKNVPRADQPAANQLAAKLPASDAVANVDLQRLMNVALPQILAAKPQTLSEINAKIDGIKAQTGIDLRQFEQIAVGVNYRQSAAKKIDFLPVALASGKYNTEALIAAMKLAAKDKFREEKIGAKTIYIFSAKEIMPNQNGQNGSLNVLIPGLGSFIDLDKMFAGEMAVAALDANTLAFGKIERVRETLEAKPRVAAAILALVNRNANALASFGGNMPPNASLMLNFIGDDTLGKSIDAIRQVYGAFDAVAGKATVSITTRSASAEQAKTLEETVVGLQTFGKSLLGGLQGDDKKVYARMAENAKITRAVNEVNLNLQVPQSDIDVLLGKK